MQGAPKLPSDKLFFSQSEAARLVGVSSYRINLCMRSGELETRQIGARTVILRRSLEVFIAANCAQAPPERSEELAA